MKEQHRKRAHRKDHNRRNISDREWHAMLIQWWDHIIRIIARCLVAFAVLCVIAQALLLQPDIRKWLCPVEELEGFPYAKTIQRE